MQFVQGQRIANVIYGETYEGFLITEENRATVWASSEEELLELHLYMQSNYSRKGVRAVLIGVHKDGTLKYAVFTEPGFLTIVDDDGTD